MEMKIIKLIRIPITVKMSDGSTKEGYRYTDVDGITIAESLRGEVFPSAIRELEAKIDAEVRMAWDDVHHKPNGMPC